MEDEALLQGHGQGCFREQALGAQHKLVAKGTYEALQVGRGVRAIHRALPSDLVRLGERAGGEVGEGEREGRGGKVG